MNVWLNRNVYRAIKHSCIANLSAINHPSISRWRFTLFNKYSKKKLQHFLAINEKHELESKVHINHDI